MYILLKLFQKILLKSPFWLLKLIAYLAASFFYLSLRKRKIAYLNLKTAFPDKPYSEITAILKASYYNFSLSLIEFLIAERLYSNIELADNQHLKEPGVCVGIHAGSWELINIFFSRKYKYAILANRQKNAKLNHFLNLLREKEGLKVCFSLRSLVKQVKEGHYAGLVIDHGAEDEAMLTDFFNQIIPVPKGAIHLAKKLKKKIYLFFSYRVGGFKHKIELLDVIDPESKNEKELLSYFMQVYQKQLTKHPYEYLWWHKRFKYKKNREVLIISDGKPGHLKQSQALLAVLKKQNEYLIRSQTVTVKYRNYFMRVAANFLASFSLQFSPSLMRALKILLDYESYQKLSSGFFDIVISTGNFTAPIVKILASALGARSGMVLRTNLSPDKFDLAVIPEHDRVYSSQAVKIKGALTYPLDLEKKRKECESFFKLSSEKKLAVFVGGPVFDSTEFTRNLKYFIKQLKSFSLEKGYKLLISTSRRTQPEAESCLETMLRNFDNTEALVIASKENYNFIFEGFVLLSDIVFCSSESISMLTEIASLKKPCVCTFLETEDDKRRVFLNSMRREINFLRYPFKIKGNDLKVSNILNENQKAIEKASRKLFTLK